MKPKVYPVLEMAVDDGVVYGLNRAYKYTDNPSREEIIAQITNSVMNSICEWFELSDEDRDRHTDSLS
jgi:hypothetical protein